MAVPRRADSAPACARAQQVRVLVTPMTGYAVGIKEIQVFSYP
jgi:hypothetical protein